MQIKLIDFIKQLQDVYDRCNKEAHGEPSLKFDLNFPKNPKLDDAYWDVEVEEVTAHLRLGCMCEDAAVIELNATEYQFHGKTNDFTAV